MTTRSDDRSIISENLKYILISFFEKIRGQNLICQKKTKPKIGHISRPQVRFLTKKKEQLHLLTHLL